MENSKEVIFLTPVNTEDAEEVKCTCGATVKVSPEEAAKIANGAIGLCPACTAATLKNAEQKTEDPELKAALGE